MLASASPFTWRRRGAARCRLVRVSLRIVADESLGPRLFPRPLPIFSCRGCRCTREKDFAPCFSTSVNLLSFPLLLVFFLSGRLNTLSERYRLDRWPLEVVSDPVLLPGNTHSIRCPARGPFGSLFFSGAGGWGDLLSFFLFVSLFLAARDQRFAMAQAFCVGRTPSTSFFFFNFFFFPPRDPPDLKERRASRIAFFLTRDYV